MNKDPKEEVGGLNTYVFVRNGSGIRIDPNGLYEYEWESVFSEHEKEMIINSIGRVDARIEEIISQIDESIAELRLSNCPCYDGLLRKLTKLKALLNRMLNEIRNPKFNLEVYRVDYNGDPEATYLNSPVPWYDDELRLDNGWFDQTQDRQDHTIFHELTHGQGTQDDDENGCYNNAHALALLMYTDLKHWHCFNADKKKIGEKCSRHGP